MIMSLDSMLQEGFPQQAIQWNVIQFEDLLWKGMPYEGTGMVRYPEAGGETTHAAVQGWAGHQSYVNLVFQSEIDGMLK